MYRPVTPALLGAAVLLPAALRAQQPAATGNGGTVIVAHAAEIAWKDGPPSLPRGAQFAVLEGDPGKAEPLTFRLKLPANYRIPPHWHTALEHVTVLQGTLNVAMGDQATYTGGTALKAGSFGVIPVKMVHRAWTGAEETVIQLHTIGPWTITYVNPADDPRKPAPAGGR